MVYYAARRHLGYSPEEWDHLPWWQARLYLEGMRMEFDPDHAEPAQATDDLGLFGVSVRQAS